MDKEKKLRGILSPYEVAALTAGVPASGDARIDRMITEGLRLKIAMSAMEGILSNPNELSRDEVPELALAYADLLLAELRKR